MPLSLIIAIVGGLLYLVLGRLDRMELFAEVCRLAFAVGLLAWLLLLTR